MSLNDGTQSYGAVGEDEAPDGDINDEMDSLDPEESRYTPPPTDDLGLQEDFNPGGRLKQVRTRASKYEREYRLQLLHRLLMRRVPLDQIASQLGVSVQTVMRDRSELYKRLREQAQKLDINQIIGDTVGFYEETKAMSLRIASNNKNKMSARLGAMRTALAAKNDMHRFFQASGVFEVLRYKSAGEDSLDDIQTLVELSKTLLEADDDLSSIQNDLPDIVSLVDDSDEDEDELMVF